MSNPARLRIATLPRALSAACHTALDALTGAGVDLIFPAPGRHPTSGELAETLPACVGYLAGVELVRGATARRAQTAHRLSPAAPVALRRVVWQQQFNRQPGGLFECQLGRGREQRRRPFMTEFLTDVRRVAFEFAIVGRD